MKQLEQHLRDRRALALFIDIPASIVGGLAIFVWPALTLAAACAALLWLARAARPEPDLSTPDA
jgi:hypothetical protein